MAPREKMMTMPMLSRAAAENDHKPRFKFDGFKEWDEGRTGGLGVCAGEVRPAPARNKLARAGGALFG